MHGWKPGLHAATVSTDPVGRYRRVICCPVDAQSRVGKKRDRLQLLNYGWGEVIDTCGSGGKLTAVLFVGSVDTIGV